MDMTKLIITTKYGNVYKIDGERNIIRTDIKGFKASGQWKLIGIEHVKQSRFIRADSIANWLESKPDMLFKNGNPQWTVRDLDHGTTRVWGNTEYHGIRSIQAA
jgi:hypothetical protein